MIIRWMIIEVRSQLVGLGVERLKTARRGSEGAKPTGKFSEAEKPKGFFE